jgi:hypothetical protein
MSVNKLTKLIGLKFEEYLELVDLGKIKHSQARLIPALKTGDELALCSIFLSSLRLVREFRNKVFSDIKLPKGGKAYYFTEWSFDGIEKSKKGDSRIDGVIIIVVSGKIKDVAFIEVKKDKNEIEVEQIERYQRIANDLKVTKLVTISNQFVEKPTDFPIKINARIKNVKTFHFSWTYLETIAQLLLFENDENIEDEDQVELMKEVLYYLTHPKSGTSGYHQMKEEWKALADDIKGNNKPESHLVEQSILSWHEEEKDLSLMLSRGLGVLVRNKKGKDTVKSFQKNNTLHSTLDVKNIVSNISIHADFTRRTVSMSVSINPVNKGSIGKLSWLRNQLEQCEKRNPYVFDNLKNDIWIETDIKFYKDCIKEKYIDFENLYEDETIKQKEITGFSIVLIQDFKGNFASRKKFVELIEKMILDYYQGIVQHLKNWNPPAPRVKKENKESTEQ